MNLNVTSKLTTQDIVWGCERLISKLVIDYSGTGLWLAADVIKTVENSKMCIIIVL